MQKIKLTFQLISRHETGRLGVFAKKSHVERLTECDAFFDSLNEYYFERSPIIFEYIVDFYVTGEDFSYKHMGKGREAQRKRERERERENKRERCMY